jgi:hypothetical protein
MNTLSETASNDDPGTQYNNLEQMKYIKPVVLARAVMTVSYVENADNKDAEAIAKTALVPAHHPCIGMLKLYNLLISPYLIKTR